MQNLGKIYTYTIENPISASCGDWVLVVLSLMVISLFLVGCGTGEAGRKSGLPNRCNIGDMCEDISGLKDKAEDTKKTFGELDARIGDLELEVEQLEEVVQGLPGASATIE